MQEAIFYPYIRQYCDVCTHYRKDLHHPPCCTANRKSPDTAAGVVVCNKVESCTAFTVRALQNVYKIQ